MSRVETSDDEIIGYESPLNAPGRDSDIRFLTARFLRRLDRLEINKMTVSGRPVYYTETEQQFFVSTHLKSFRDLGLSLEEEPRVVSELLRYRYISPPRTLFRGIQQLSISGRIALQLNPLGWKLDVSGCYTPSSVSRINRADVSADLVKGLSSSVNRLQGSAERVGSLLSGGLDSSILSSLADKQLGAVDTFSTTYPFEDPQRDFETKYAASAAAALSLRHRVFIPKSLDFVLGCIEALAVSETSLHHLQSVLLHLLFKHSIPRHLDRVLCGEGADSAWGLSSHQMLRRAHTLRQRLFASLPFRTGLQAAGKIWPKALEFSSDIRIISGFEEPLSSPQSSVWSFGAYGDTAWIQAHYRAPEDDIIENRYKIVNSLADKTLEDVIALYSLYCDVAATTSIWSKLGEAQRKIVYYPFLESALLDLAFSEDWNSKSAKPKFVLLRTGARLGIPSFILNRPKKSFGINPVRWCKKGGPLEPLIQVAAKVVDLDALRSLQGTASASAMTLWSLLNYAILKRLFIWNEPVEDLLDEALEHWNTATPGEHRARKFTIKLGFLNAHEPTNRR